MGAFFSKQEPSPPPSQEFDQPWRTMPWGKNDLEKKLRDFRLNQPNIRFVRILLIGETGAGKSSFINSVNNAFQKRITSGALANTAIYGESFTKTYETHYIEGEDGSLLPFAFNDVMGFEKSEAGVTTQDLKRALHGFLPEGYNFEKASSSCVQDSCYRSNPSLEEQTFCVVNIIAADKVSMMDDSLINKMKNIRKAAAELKLPQVIIMTRPDIICPLVKGDVRKVYTSKKIKEKMQICSHLLGIPVNHIFPVKNYHEEMDTDDDTDALIFKALDQIVNIACDVLKKKSSNSGDKPK
ncbi:interferon-induced protein 44-like [Neoarius graeffei]|uniref:interferon-induced protein 44-like n=1 Tax=Neoarius graeffei TaxID=443677 RepID=UPI00298CAEDC|nr:interferon-induced protein 44-like [Neoarius graeffei]XP_060754508.1 interferon-induced protein 44-like [Neoarius graeffei]XP_060754509.1 interferon-induced protein 44-like [Neoarius graeffei]XP_060754510.1 interferon-induced protein 44-like [Neoarius graeffei]XP_060754511.1 interferon-induced protein 44-like [Neoarius graeffei]XP_060754512.1 interferon-induced protein 44-like [Neoarius graeffei]XP_060754513.1 interferon-induced protein 44-like [Neoarius graeffei]XP_060754514.1 interferon